MQNDQIFNRIEYETHANFTKNIFADSIDKYTYLIITKQKSFLHYRQQSFQHPKNQQQHRHQNHRTANHFPEPRRPNELPAGNSEKRIGKFARIRQSEILTPTSCSTAAARLRVERKSLPRCKMQLTL